MADKWKHRIAGIICYLILLRTYIVFVILHPILGMSVPGIFIYLKITDIPWITVGLAMTVFGAELPDYDRYRQETASERKAKGDNPKIDSGGEPKKGTSGKKKVKPSKLGKILGSLITHRSALTHSPLIPFCSLILASSLMPAQGAVVAIILIVFFLFGHASHLMLDIHESKDAPKDEYKGKVENKSSKGNPTKNSYCLHFGIATLSERRTKWCLVFFSFIEILSIICVLVKAP